MASRNFANPRLRRLIGGNDHATIISIAFSHQISTRNRFGRVASGLFPGFPDNGTAYLQGAGHDGYNGVGRYFIDGSTFGVSSIDLAAFGGGYNDISAVFRGWLSNGTILTESVSGTGIDFRMINFGPEWSSGLTLFGVANAIDSPDGWSVDNLVVIVSEPATCVSGTLRRGLAGIEAAMKRVELPRPAKGRDPNDTRARILVAAFQISGSVSDRILIAGLIYLRC